MNKSTNKRNNYNIQVVERLSKKYDVTKRFVTMALRGDRNSETAGHIKKDYKRLVKRVESALNHY